MYQKRRNSVFLLLALSLVLSSFVAIFVTKPSLVWAQSTNVAAPTFSPAAGTYSSPQTVQIQSATSTAMIRYTLDGTEPTDKSPLYGAPIQVTTTTTIKAVAYLPTVEAIYKSDVATATYTIQTMEQTATPTLNPAGGTYTETQTVTIQTATAGATIHYTTNGDEPTTTSTIYTAPITVDTNMTIKAKAYATDMTDSDTATATYTIITESNTEEPFTVGTAVYVAIAVVAIVAVLGVATLYWRKRKQPSTKTST